MLEINLLSRILNLVGRVAWCTPVAHSDNNRVGVEFIEIDQRQRNYLKDFLSLRKDIV
jgi:Tfp pilus assembly protein PilZ